MGRQNHRFYRAKPYAYAVFLGVATHDDCISITHELTLGTVGHLHGFVPRQVISSMEP